MKKMPMPPSPSSPRRLLSAMAGLSACRGHRSGDLFVFVSVVISVLPQGKGMEAAVQA
uniref:Predicted protein n=1 Tax=Hordeum vulgare subsp. vulgare TaxID=112509 RepID=F2EAJ9_HORVV|nr:predicted protein [Hordeum vulgare subsp. vulgare]